MYISIYIPKYLTSASKRAAKCVFWRQLLGDFPILLMCTKYRGEIHISKQGTVVAQYVFLKHFGIAVHILNSFSHLESHLKDIMRYCVSFELK